MREKNDGEQSPLNHLEMRTKDARHIKRCAAHPVFHVDGLIGSVVQEPAHEQNVPFCGGPVEGCHITKNYRTITHHQIKNTRTC